MATHRVIEKAAGTGERTCSLSPLEFRVWVQYLLSADDYGICPAEAIKLQADCPALQRESAKRVQAALERLVAVGLCGVFADGQRRYLYQSDWQEFQRIKHPTRTALPPPPAEVLEKCSAKTAELFLLNHPKLPGELRPHGNAHATATATATANTPAAEPAPAMRVAAAGPPALEVGPGPLRRPPSLIPRRDLSAFLQGPIFSVPQKWADKVLAAANGHLTEKQLTEFAQALFDRVEAQRIDVAGLPNFLGWLDEELRAWRGTKAAPAGPSKAERDHDARLAAMEGSRG